MGGLGLGRETPLCDLRHDDPTLAASVEHADHLEQDHPASVMVNRLVVPPAVDLQQL